VYFPWRETGGPEGPASRREGPSPRPRPTPRGRPPGPTRAPPAPRTPAPEARPRPNRPSAPGLRGRRTVRGAASGAKPAPVPPGGERAPSGGQAAGEGDVPAPLEGEGAGVAVQWPRRPAGGSSTSRLHIARPRGGPPLPHDTARPRPPGPPDRGGRSPAPLEGKGPFSP
jgi:hypothetical protein